jgi:transcriptional regulator GlxA family with amidase domain
MSGGVVRRVVVLAFPDVAMFELGVLCEVFGTDRSDDGFPSYEFSICTPDGKPVRTRSGFSITPHADLSALADADLVAVPAFASAGDPDCAARDTAALDALRAANDRGAYVLSVCSGAFALGEAGLLDGRQCTTHWRYADELARQFPLADVRPDVLYVEDGNIFTSAGTAAGIDLCLHLVRRVHGSAIARKLARRMVVPPHRDGGQSQYIEAPVPRTENAPTLEPLLQWLVKHLDRQVTVEDLAERAHMAPRTFARRFRAETGVTPHDWVTAQRVLLARQLLEDTDLPIEKVAAKSGFGDAATLRHHFNRRVGSAPHQYRRTFQGGRIGRGGSSVSPSRSALPRAARGHPAV